MKSSEIGQYLKDFQNRELPALTERELQVPKTQKIKVIIGPRRAGKTWFLYQIMKLFIKGGMKKEDMLYLNFENPLLMDITFKDIKEIIMQHRMLYPSKNKPVLFIDEPTGIERWENAVRGLYDEGFNIYITGSSSKLLSKEIATSLRGRSLSYLLLPFSFAEFLSAKRHAIGKNPPTEDIMQIQALLDEYLKFGGFPEVVKESDKEIRIQILNSYLDLVIYRDIVERHKVKDSLLVKWLIKSIITSYSKELSINKIYLTLKSQGRKVSKDEIYSYASMLNDSFFALYLPKFSWSVRAREPVNKAYICDAAFANLIETTKDTGRRMENAVFLELLRRNRVITEIFYYKDTQGHEVDFVVKESEKVIQLIQVCCAVQEEETMKREARALLKAGKELKCKNLLIITENEEKEETVEWFGIKAKINVVPFWKWLLER